MAYVPSLRLSRDRIVDALSELGYKPDESYPPHEGKFDRMYFRKDNEPYPRMVALHQLSGTIGISAGHLVGNWERWVGIGPYRMDAKPPNDEAALLQQIREAVDFVEANWFPEIEKRDEQS